MLCDNIICVTYYMCDNIMLCDKKSCKARQDFLSHRRRSRTDVF